MKDGVETAVRVRAFTSMNITPRGPAYTLVRLLEGMIDPTMPVDLYAAQNSWRSNLAFPCRTGAAASVARYVRVPYRYGRGLFAQQVEALLLRDLAQSDDDGIVYTWGEVSLMVSRWLKGLDRRVVREKFNCAKQTSRAILRDAYGQFGVPFVDMSDRLIEKEAEELALADAIFCPSPMVAASLIDLGIDAERLIATSYGWEPARFDTRAADPPPNEGELTLVFVGTVCVRKGAHVLLEAWSEAHIRGRLILVGDLEPLIRERYAAVLARDDVTYMPFTNDIGSVYRSANWFVFPSLEEGGPQVTYEAAGNGLPLLVSAMGAGAFARDGVDGLVVPDTKVNTWTQALCSLPDIAEKRPEFAENARRHAADFTYDKVGKQRRVALLERFGVSAAEPPSTILSPREYETIRK